MLSDARGVTPVPFSQYQAMALEMLAPNSFDEDDFEGAPFELPAACEFLAIFSTGVAGSAGVLESARMEQSPNGEDGWETIQEFSGMQQSSIKSYIVKATKKHIRLMWKITGQGGTGSLIMGVVIVI